MKIKSAILFLLLGLSFHLLFSQEQGTNNTLRIDKALEEFVKDPVLSNASISFYAEDMETGLVLSQYNPSILLSPASTMKLFTTAAALEILGADCNFKTDFYYNGIIDQEGVLHGNVIIKGGGDPVFYSSSFSSYYYSPDIFSIVVEELKKAGIKSIKGKVIGDASYYTDNNVPSTWIEADIANYFGAAPFALSILDNEYTIVFKTGEKAGDSCEIVKIIPEIPQLDLLNVVKSQNVKDDRSVIFGGQWDNLRIITGSLPFQKNNFEVKGSIPDPPLYAAYRLKESIEKTGISISDSCISFPGMIQYNKDTIPRTLLYSVKSPALSEIVFRTNIKSVNLYAEHLLRQIGIKISNTGSNSIGTKSIEEFWFPVTGKYLMYDGSGLSRFNAVSAKQLVSVLKFMKTKSKNFDVFYNSLPIASRSGSLSSMFSGTYAENNLRAKSGYMSGVRSYAGYVSSKSKKNIAFAIIVNNYTSSAYEVKLKIEQLLLELSAL